MAGGWPGGRPWRPTGWPRGGTGGRPAIQSVLSGGCGCEAPCVRAPTPCNRPRPACALPRVLTRRRSDLCASSLPGRGLSACSIRMLPPAPPECLLPPSAPRHRAPSAPGTCRRRWLERGRRACPSRSTTRTCPTPRTTAAVPPRRHRRSCLPLALGGGTTSWPRTRTVVLRRLQAPAATNARTSRPVGSLQLKGVRAGTLRARLFTRPNQQNVGPLSSCGLDARHRLVGPRPHGALTPILKCA